MRRFLAYLGLTPVATISAWFAAEAMMGISLLGAAAAFMPASLSVISGALFSLAALGTGGVVIAGAAVGASLGLLLYGADRLFSGVFNYFKNRNEASSTISTPRSEAAANDENTVSSTRVIGEQLAQSGSATPKPEVEVDAKADAPVAEVKAVEAVQPEDEDEHEISTPGLG